MSIRPEQPEPFLRGCVFPAVTDAPYPRADPAGADYLPADVWDAAQLPVGVRLELAGEARTIRVWYKTTRASLGYRGESAGCSFVAYRGGQKVAMAEAVMGEGMAELVIAGRTDLPVTVYLPEGMQPLITGVAGVEQTMVPAPLQPRWLAYGDAVTQGWLASAPAMAWPAVAGRKLGLDVCNLGYAGTARGETTSALMLAETPAEVVTIAFGLNNWSRVPHTTGLMAEEVRCFLSVVRKGHPDIPVVVVSPTARPDAENVPNRVGATLAELRRAMEVTVHESIAEGDDMLFLVEGLATVDPEDLEDGMYPGDEGHRRLAAAVAKILLPHLAGLQSAAAKRWANEGVPSTPGPSTLAAPRAGVVGAGAVDAGDVGPGVGGARIVDPPVVGAGVVDAPVADAVADAPVADGGVVDAGVVDAGVVDAPVVDAPVVDAEVVDTPVESGSVDQGSENGPLAGDTAFPKLDFEAWNGALFDTSAPDFGLPNDDPTEAPARNFDLPDMDALDRQSLNDALLDALAPKVSSRNGSSVDGSTADATPVNGTPVNGTPVNGHDMARPTDPSAVVSAPIDPGTIDTPRQDPSVEPPAIVGSTYVDTSVVDPFYGDPAFIDPSYTEQAYPEEAYVDQSYVDQSYVDQSYGEQSYGEQSYVDQSYVDQTYVDQSYVDQSYVDQSYVDQSYVDQSYVDQSYVDQSYVDQSYVDQSYVDQSYVDQSYVDQTYRDQATVAPAFADGPAPAGNVVTAPAVGVVTAAPPGLVAEAEPAVAASAVATAVATTAVATTTVAETNGGAGESGSRGTGAPAVRRSGAPVDIAVADMVVAALSLATNGADEGSFVQDAGPDDQLQWAEAADPTLY